MVTAVLGGVARPTDVVLSASRANGPAPTDATERLPAVDYPSLIDNHLAIPARVRDNWSELVQAVVRGGLAEQLHAARDEYRGIVLGWIDQLERFLAFCRRVSGPTSPEPPLVAELDRGLRDLRGFHDRLF